MHTPQPQHILHLSTKNNESIPLTTHERKTKNKKGVSKIRKENSFKEKVLDFLDK